MNRVGIIRTRIETPDESLVSEKKSGEKKRLWTVPSPAHRAQSGTPGPPAVYTGHPPNLRMTPNSNRWIFLRVVFWMDNNSSTEASVGKYYDVNA